MELLCAFILPNTTAMTLPAQESKPSTKHQLFVIKVPTDVASTPLEHQCVSILLEEKGSTALKMTNFTATLMTKELECVLFLLNTTATRAPALERTPLTQLSWTVIKVPTDVASTPLEHQCVLIPLEEQGSTVHTPLTLTSIAVQVRSVELNVSLLHLRAVTVSFVRALGSTMPLG